MQRATLSLAMGIATALLMGMPMPAGATEGHAVGYYLEAWADGYLNHPTNGATFAGPTALLQVNSSPNHQITYACDIPSYYPNPTYSIKWNLEIVEDGNTSISQNSSGSWPNFSNWAAYSGAVLHVTADFDLIRSYSTGSHSDQAWAEVYTSSDMGVGTDTHSFTIQ